MKYFTKYLPVEGEIKEGDKIFFKQDGTRGLMSEKGLPKWLIDKCKENSYKTGKLFLCSRDIQVGDKVWWTDPEDGLSSQFNTALEVSKDIIFMSELNASEIEAPPHEVIKVIGEVSPDAVWVTEEMEFEEDNLRFWYKHRKFTDEGFVIHYPVVDWKGEDKNKYRVIVKAKCPTCKTFH